MHLHYHDWSRESILLSTSWAPDIHSFIKIWKQSPSNTLFTCVVSRCWKQYCPKLFEMNQKLKISCRNFLFFFQWIQTVSLLSSEKGNAAILDPIIHSESELWAWWWNVFFSPPGSIVPSILKLEPVDMGTAAQDCTTNPPSARWNVFLSNYWLYAFNSLPKCPSLADDHYRHRSFWTAKDKAVLRLMNY